MTLDEKISTDTLSKTRLRLWLRALPASPRSNSEPCHWYFDL